MTTRLATLSLLAAAALPAAAHGVRVEATLEPPVVVVEASYGAGPTLGDATLRVYGPGEQAPLFQRGSTDVAGRFAFVPDRPGTWSVVVLDGEGHRGSVRVEIDEAFLEGRGAGRVSGSAWPLLARWALGIALIFGVTGLAFWGKARALLRARERDS